MANDPEYERLKDALRQASTPEARKQAADAMREYLQKRQLKGQHSKPTIVSLNLGKGYPNAVFLEDAPEEMADNPAFYDLMKKVVAGD